MRKRRRSEAQSETARRNGSQSSGPVTPEGKATSSLNAVTHGLLSRSAVLPGEDRAEFERLLAGAMAKYSPRDDQEQMLVRQLVMHHWRQLRVWAMQTAGLSGAILSQTETPPDLPQRDMAWRAWDAAEKMQSERKALELLHRYEVSFENRFDRRLKELDALLRKRDSGDRSWN